MIRRRRTTRRVPSAETRTRSSSQPPCSARSTSSLVTTLREKSREMSSRSNSHSTPRPSGRWVGWVLTSFSRDVVERLDDLVRQGEILDAEGVLELGGGARPDDRSCHPGAVAHPREGDLE